MKNIIIFALFLFVSLSAMADPMSFPFDTNSNYTPLPKNFTKKQLIDSINSILYSATSSNFFDFLPSAQQIEIVEQAMSGTPKDLSLAYGRRLNPEKPFGTLHVRQNVTATTMMVCYTSNNNTRITIGWRNGLPRAGIVTKFPGVQQTNITYFDSNINPPASYLSIQLPEIIDNHFQFAAADTCNVMFVNALTGNVDSTITLPPFVPIFSRPAPFCDSVMIHTFDIEARHNVDLSFLNSAEPYFITILNSSNEVIYIKALKPESWR